MEEQPDDLGFDTYNKILAKQSIDNIRTFHRAQKNNIGVIIAGAGGSAHLPGMISALTSLPVLGVPIESKKLKGLDSLLSMVQMLLNYFFNFQNFIECIRTLNG